MEKPRRRFWHRQSVRDFNFDVVLSHAEQPHAASTAVAAGVGEPRWISDVAADDPADDGAIGGGQAFAD
jgi:hypothetical protein